MNRRGRRRQEAVHHNVQIPELSSSDGAVLEENRRQQPPRVAFVSETERLRQEGWRLQHHSRLQRRNQLLIHQHHGNENGNRNGNPHNLAVDGAPNDAIVVAVAEHMQHDQNVFVAAHNDNPQVRRVRRRIPTSLLVQLVDAIYLTVVDQSQLSPLARDIFYHFKSDFDCLLRFSWSNFHERTNHFLYLPARSMAIIEAVARELGVPLGLGDDGRPVMLPPPLPPLQQAAAVGENNNNNNNEETEETVHFLLAHFVADNNGQPLPMSQQQQPEQYLYEVYLNATYAQQAIVGYLHRYTPHRYQQQRLELELLCIGEHLLLAYNQGSPGVAQPQLQPQQQQQQQQQQHQQQPQNNIITRSMSRRGISQQGPAWHRNVQCREVSSSRTAFPEDIIQQLRLQPPTDFEQNAAAYVAIEGWWLILHSRLQRFTELIRQQAADVVFNVFVAGHYVDYPLLPPDYPNDRQHEETYRRVPFLLLDQLVDAMGLSFEDAPQLQLQLSPPAIALFAQFCFEFCNMLCIFWWWFNEDANRRLMCLPARSMALLEAVARQRGFALVLADGHGQELPQLQPPPPPPQAVVREEDDNNNNDHNNEEEAAIEEVVAFLGARFVPDHDRPRRRHQGQEPEPVAMLQYIVYAQNLLTACLHQYAPHYLQRLELELMCIVEHVLPAANADNQRVEGGDQPQQPQRPQQQQQPEQQPRDALDG